MEHTNSAVAMEKLRGTMNYRNWSFQMKNVLIYENLWQFVTGTTVSAATEKADLNHQEEKARARICLSVDKSCYAHIIQAKTAKDVWDALQKAYDDTGLHRRLTCLRTLCSIKLEQFVSMETYVNEILSLSDQLSSMGKPLDDEFIAAIMLQGLPQEYEPMIMALEHSSIDLTTDKVKTKLLQDKRWKGTATDGDDCLFTRNRGYNKNSSRGDDKKLPSTSKHASTSSNAKKKLWCWKCRSKGHVKKDCTQSDDGSKTNLVLTALSTAKSDTSWIIDSGATNHMSGCRDWFDSLHDSSTKEVCVANGKKLVVSGKGDVHFTCKFNGELLNITLKDVLFIPDLTVNLISVSCLTEKLFKLSFTDKTCNFIKSGKVVLSARKIGRVYILLTVGRANLTTSATSKDMMLWHQRLGHLNFDSLASLRKVANGIDFQVTTQKEVCEVCLKGKQSRAPFVTNPNKRVAKARLDLIHTDVVGPMPTTSLGGKRYILTFLDDYSRKVFVFPIAKKSDVCKYTINFIKFVENQCNAKVKVLRSDNGTEYVNTELTDFLKRKGIVHQLTVPYSPQQNGSAERFNRSLLDKVRCLLFNANLDDKMWAEAANTAAFLINRSPSSRLSGKIPEEVWSGNKVNLKYLRVFGCEAFAHIDDCKRKKLDPKSKKLIFLGYCENVKGYRLFNPDDNKIIVSRDVVFNESVFPGRRSNRMQKHMFEPIFLTGGGDEEHLNTTPVEAELERDSVELSDYPVEAERELASVDSPNYPVEAECEHDCVPTEDHLEVPQEVQESSSHRYNLRPRIPKPTCNVTNVSNVAEPLEPRTVKEALSCEDKELWQKAMKEEIDSFILHGAWELTDKPVDKNVVKNKWIFTLKRDSDGNITRYKARLVAKGFTQKYGEDFKETFSPVVRHCSIRLLLALAVQFDLKIDHLDVQTAFLNGDLREEIYMQQPEGFMCPGSENKVYRLRKAVYGLKQASRSWYEKVKDVLLSLGYTQCKQEDCIFIRKSGESIVYIALYVDDFFVFYNDNRLAELLKSSLLRHFKLKDLGQVRNMLGIKVERDANSIKLSQENRIDKLLDRFGMTDCKSVKSPMITNISSSESTCATNNIVSKFPYQELLGSLMYLCVTTRPDISFAVSYLSQFNSCYTEFHWMQAKRIVRYLKGTKQKALVFKKSNVNPSLEGYSDADWASDVDRKSYTGFVFKYGGNSISWGSYKQSCISLSSTEAEYISLSEASREAVFLQALLRELVMLSFCRITLYCDNQSAMQLAVNHVHHKRSKHIEVRYHYVRDMIERFDVKLLYIPTEAMVADVFTKPLGCVKHQLFTSQLGVT